jgi:hypothetical protein
MYATEDDQIERMFSFAVFNYFLLDSFTIIASFFGLSRETLIRVRSQTDQNQAIYNSG